MSRQRYVNGRWVDADGNPVRVRRRVLKGGSGFAVTGRGWPVRSDAAGVHPRQRQEAMDHAREVGVPTEFDEEGRAVFRTRNHRKRYLKAVGMIDRDAGYGDPSP